MAEDENALGADVIPTFLVMSVSLFPSHHHERLSRYSATAAVQSAVRFDPHIHWTSPLFAPLSYGANDGVLKNAKVTFTIAPFASTHRMTNITQLAVDDMHREASNRAKLGSALKEQLKSALLVLDTFDQSALASLATDEEYKLLVQRLFSPLTSTPLSSIAKQSEHASRPTLDAVPAQVVKLPSSVALDDPLAPKISSHLRPRYETQLFAPAPRKEWFSPLDILQEDTSKAPSTMLTIHFLSGRPKPSTEMQEIVDRFNACIDLHLSFYRDSFPDGPPPVMEARTTRSGDRVVLGLSLGKFTPRAFAEVTQNVDLSSFWSSDAITHFRRGGIVDFVIRIHKLAEDVANAHSAELIRQVEDFLASYCGAAVKMSKKISPTIYLCEGRKSALDQFSPAFEEGFDFIVGSVPGRRRIFPGVVVEGFVLSDSFDFA